MNSVMNYQEGYEEEIDPNFLIPQGWHHRRTGRHFTGGTKKVCPENNNLP